MVFMMHFNLMRTKTVDVDIMISYNKIHRWTIPTNIKKNNIHFFGSFFYDLLDDDLYVKTTKNHA